MLVLPLLFSVTSAECAYPFGPMPRDDLGNWPIMLDGNLFVFGGLEDQGNWLGFQHPLILDAATRDWREYTETSVSDRRNFMVRVVRVMT